MNSKSILIAGTLAAACTAAFGQVRYTDEDVVRVARGPDWNLNAPEGACRVQVYVDDRARVELRGDQVFVRTETGRRSYDQGTVCSQPLPFDAVADFRVTAERGRGTVTEVTPPTRRNGFTGGITIHDPQDDGAAYEVVIAWRHPGAVAIAPPPVAPLAAVDPLPAFDETRACQDQVRADFIRRNDDGSAYLEFSSAPLREIVGPNRDRIRGEAWARNRVESRPVHYECVVNHRQNRVVTSMYEVLPRSRYSRLY